MENFKDIEINERFLYNHIFWLKTGNGTATLISDTKYEEGRAKFMDMYGHVASFDSLAKVKKHKGDLLCDKYVDSHPSMRPPTRTDWPASKHPG